MTKFVITTTQTVVRRYYVEVDDPSWAHDGIVMNELEEFSQSFLSEDVVDTRQVDEFPKAAFTDSVNAATMFFDNDAHQWEKDVRWDLK